MKKSSVLYQAIQRMKLKFGKGDKTPHFVHVAQSVVF